MNPVLTVHHSFNILHATLQVALLLMTKRWPRVEDQRGPDNEVKHSMCYPRVNNVSPDNGKRP